MKMTSLGMIAFIIMTLAACGDPAEKVASVNFILPPANEEDSPQAFFFDKGASYPVACYYYDTEDKNYGQEFFLYNTAWKFAKDTDDRWIYTEGDLQDGFYVAKKLYGWSLTQGKGRDIPQDLKLLETLCRQTIDRDFPKGNMALYKIAAVQSSFSPVEYPLVIGEAASRNVITRLVIFGDSLSDTGNLKKWIPAFVLPPYFWGRFANGPVWNDHFSIFADVTVQNWAYGGAVTKKNIDTELNLSPSKIIQRVKSEGRALVTGSIDNQVNKYIEDYLTDRKIESPSNTLFVVWIGANDYISVLDEKNTATIMVDNPNDPQNGSNSIIVQSVAATLEQVRKLYKVGARNFLIINLPDLGRTPAMAINTTYRAAVTSITPMEKRYDLARAMTDICKKHNESLAKGVANLKSTLPGSRIFSLDIFDAMDKMFSGIGPDGSPNFDYGISIEKTTLTKKGYPDIQVGKQCYTGTYFGTKNLDEKVCPGPKRALFWDMVHPTTTVHCGISYDVHKTLQDGGMIAMPADMNQYRQACISN